MDTEPRPTIFGHAVQFLYAIGLPPMRILQGLVFLLIGGLIFAALFVFDTSNLFKSSTLEPEDEKPIEFAASPDLGPKVSSLTEQIDEIYYFKQDDSVNYVVAIGEIEAQNVKIRELLEREDLSEEQRYQLQFTLLRHGQSVIERNLKAEVLERIEVDEFKKFARSFIGGEDARLEDFAKSSIAGAEVMLLQRRPSEENAKQVLAALIETKSSFLNNENRALGLYKKLLDARTIHPGKPHIDQTISDFGKLLGSSEKEDVLSLATNVAQFSRFAPFQPDTLERRIRFKTKESLQDLDKSLRVLGEHPETDIVIWETLIRAYESSLSSGQTGVLETGWRIASDLVAKLPESDERKVLLESSLDKQLKRSKLFGSKVDLQSGTTFQGGSLLLSGEKPQIIVFANRRKKAAKVMASIQRKQKLGVQLNRPIFVFKDDYTAIDRKQLDSVGNSVQLSSFETAQELIEKLSIDVYPYIVMVDTEGSIIAVDLSVEQAIQRLVDSQ